MITPQQHSRNLAVALLVSFVTVAPVEIARAGSDNSVNLPRTGQSRIGADNGPLADGNVRAGLALLPLRFTDNGDATSTDTMTGLTWLQDANLMASRDPGFDIEGQAGDGFVTWATALDYVASLNAESYLGHADWRLPNVVEMETLENLDADTLREWLRGTGAFDQQNTGQAFANVPTWWWTSTTVASDGTMAWRYLAAPGRSDKASKLGDEAVAWAVRGSADGPARPWQSGQILTYRAGDDGDLQAGGAASTPRFSAHGDGTVSDGLTGLMWTQDGNGPGPVSCMPDTVFRSLVWYKNSANPDLDNIQDYVLCLNAQLFLGYSDWRVPNRHELRSLLDHGSFLPALSAGHPFVNVQSDFYWVASDFFDDGQSLSDQAWMVNLGDGAMQGDNKLNSRRIWPVRGGETGSSTAALTDPAPVENSLLIFPDTTVGEQSTKTLTLASTGQSSLVVGQFNLESVARISNRARTGDPPVFSLANDGCSNTIVPAADNCLFDVVLIPSTFGSNTATLVLPTSADQGQPRRLNLIAQGLEAPIFRDGFELPVSGKRLNTLRQSRGR